MLELYNDDLLAGTDVTITLTSNANGVVIADSVRLVTQEDPGYPFYWNLDFPEPARYKIFARWPAGNWAEDAKYEVIQPGHNLYPITINQQQLGGGEWQYITTVTVGEENLDNVQLLLHGNATGSVIADAIKIEVIDESRDTTTPSLLHIHNDHLGTPRILTNASQEKVWEIHTTPFGEVHQEIASGVEQLLAFPGQYRDGETGYSYNHYRDYDASLGRYIQSDPIGLRGGLNTYGYVGGNPLNYIDQYGLSASCATTGSIWSAAACSASGAITSAGNVTLGAASTVATGLVLMAIPSGLGDGTLPDDLTDDELCDNDGCDELAADIQRFVETLKSRYADLNSDPKSLSIRAWDENPGGDLDGCGTYWGHIVQYEAWRQGLKNRIQEAKNKGCPYNSEADIWAKEPPPLWPGCYGQ